MDKNRKTLYYVGGIMIGVGFILFISVFFSAFSGNFDTFILAPIGMVLIIVGGFVRNIGQKGAAGSGVILDPQKAREDLKPFSKQAGGMISDAIEEIKPIAKEVIKVRCRECSSLNDEEAKFCNNCGAKL